MVMYKITVGPQNADIIGSTNKALQEAVDRIAENGGGEVKVLPGRYIMKDSLHLKSGVMLCGSGSDTVLFKPLCVESNILYYLGYGHYDASVMEPEKFEKGMGVYITGDKCGGFHSTVATITEIRGSELLLSRKLNSDYTPWHDGKVITVYPIISGCNIENAGIRDLLIDGNAEENQYINGCRGGGIYFLQAHNIKVNNVEVKNYNGDGISFQACKSMMVENCRLIGNSGYGLHPGSGSVGSIIRDCEILNNGNDGIFYCLRVTYSLCEDCTIKGNKGVGISIGSRDTDNIIKNNIIADSGKSGVLIRGPVHAQSAHRTLLEGNLIKNNCRIEGEAQISVKCPVTEFRVIGNKFEASKVSGAKTAMYIDVPVNGIYFFGNDTSDCEAVRSASSEYMENVFFEKPEKPLLIGPENITEHAYDHLGDE